MEFPKFHLACSEKNQATTKESTCTQFQTELGAFVLLLSENCLHYDGRTFYSPELTFITVLDKLRKESVTFGTILYTYNNPIC